MMELTLAGVSAVVLESLVSLVWCHCEGLGCYDSGLRSICLLFFINSTIVGYAFLSVLVARFCSAQVVVDSVANPCIVANPLPRSFS